MTLLIKVFKTIDEQLEILKQRGLMVDDEDEAKDFLLHNNYYRISGYSLTLRNHDTFYSGTTFQNIIDIYKFDMELRNLLLLFIEKIEVSFKSIYTYEFSKIYGGLGYVQSTFFENWESYLSIMSKVEKQVKKRKSHEAFLKHFIDENHEPIPFWALIDLFTISDISQLYDISNQTLKINIAQNYNMTFRNAANTLSKFMHGITIVRNLCAHNSRLYNRPFITKPSLSRNELAFLNKDENGTVDNSRLFGYILNIKRLLSPSDFDDFKNKLLVIHNKYSFVNMKYYGFCDDWHTKL